MTRLTFQILSFFCDIWLFILLCASCTTLFKVPCVLRDSLEIDIHCMVRDHSDPKIRLQKQHEIYIIKKEQYLLQ